MPDVAHVQLWHRGDAMFSMLCEAHLAGADTKARTRDEEAWRHKHVVEIDTR